MKKMILAATAVATMTTMASAGTDTAISKFFDKKNEVGIALVSQEATFNSYKADDTEYGVNLNMVMLKNATKDENCRLSWGMKMGVEITEQYDETQYLVDFLPMVSFEVTPEINVAAMAGYTVGTLDSNDISGFSYGVEVGYQINPEWRAVAGYTKSDLDITTSIATSDYEMDRFTLGVGYNF